MPAEKINIESFLRLREAFPILDVRSPGEYLRAHIPGAVSLPLFSDEERAVVGTLYNRQGRQPAIKAGLDFFGPKMHGMVTEAENLGSKALLVHCWRGGMRSAAIAWLFDLYGFKVYTLGGGYKAFRHWVLEQFQDPKPLQILGGYTGAGKTRFLRENLLAGNPVIDLEALAGHKGSAFGGIGLPPQPSQEMFENLLASRLAAYDGQTPIWLEDEDRRIGQVCIPDPLRARMLEAPLQLLEKPFGERLATVIEDYGHCPVSELEEAIVRIRKRLGSHQTKMALQYLSAGLLDECFAILLAYYDKAYMKALNARPQPTVLGTPDQAVL